MAGRDILLNYVMKAKAYEPIAGASRAYLNNVMVIVPLKGGADAGVYECTTTASVAQYTNSHAYVMLNNGMSKIYICAVAQYSAAAALLEASDYKYFTLLIDPAFTDVPTAIEKFDGVTGWTTSIEESATAYAGVADKNNTAFIDVANSTGDNMYAAFAALLTGARWRNQQYIPMPKVGVTSDLGKAESYFDERLSFVLNSPEFGNRLAFFVNRARAIVAPYIYEEFTLDLQSWALVYINTNMPDYNDVEAAKLQAYLYSKAREKYVDAGMVTNVVIEVRADQDDFVMTGNIGIAKPRATWRLKVDIQQGGIE